MRRFGIGCIIVMWSWLGISQEDELYKSRIEELNKRTPIELEYNDQVKYYIELFTKTRKAQLSEIVGLSKLYFPIFESLLDKYDLPLELKYLSVVESALDPMAKSVSGAVGLWQFKIGTAQMFDLQVDSYLDERRDPAKSTEAACRYMEYLYNNFNDWHLAIAAYQAGPGTIRNALKRNSNQRTYWELQPVLPEQTQKYIPAFIAAVYVMNYYPEHGIDAINPEFTFYDTDTVHIHKALTFYDIQKVLDISIWQLRFLNPSFKRNYIPEYNGPYVLKLPRDLVTPFLENLDLIYANSDASNVQAKYAIDFDKKNKTRVTHKVKKGEFLHKLAMNYSCTIEDILAWNNMTVNDLKVGQELLIWVDDAMSDSLLHPNDTKKQSFEYTYYIVQPGDTLRDIVTKFECSSEEELLELNNISNTEEIKPGTRLLINLTR